MNKKKYNDKTLLTKVEIETIMKMENNLTLKTFFILSYESGMRPGEVRKLKWSDIKFNVDGDLSEINVFMTKNKDSKSVYVKESTFYLKKLQTDSKGDYVFASQLNKGMPIGDSTATLWVNMMGKHIGKKIYPYLLRHTRSQELYELVDKGKLSDKVAQKFLGHSKSMRDIYSDLKKGIIQEAITKQVYEFEELPQEKKKAMEEIGKINIKVEEVISENAELKKKLNDALDLIKKFDVAIEKRNKDLENTFFNKKTN
jgi:integrase